MREPARELLRELRGEIPFLDGPQFLAQIDAIGVAEWLKRRSSETFGDPRATQGLNEQIGTLCRLFARPPGVEELVVYFSQRGEQQRVRGVLPPLRIIGVGGEGVAFREDTGRGVYKAHPNDAHGMAHIVGSIAPAGSATGITIRRAPLTEVIRRYHRQTVLAEATGTEIKGVSDLGMLVTWQRELRIEPAVTRGEIDAMMRKMDGEPLEVAAGSKEVRNSWAVPDGSGNWLLAIDLKPDNILRDADDRPLVIDAIVGALPPLILERNPQLARFAATAPDQLF